LALSTVTTQATSTSENRFACTAVGCSRRVPDGGICNRYNIIPSTANCLCQVPHSKYLYLVKQLLVAGYARAMKHYLKRLDNRVVDAEHSSSEYN
jgi:hypothetical protein